MRKIKFIYIVFALILLSVIQACDMSYLDKEIEDFDTDASLANTTISLDPQLVMILY